jgi:hypothetical protein
MPHSFAAHLAGNAGGDFASSPFTGSLARAARLILDAERAFSCRCLAANNSAHSGFEGTLPINAPRAFILSNQISSHPSFPDAGTHQLALSSSVSVQKVMKSPSSNRSVNDRGIFVYPASSSSSRLFFLPATAASLFSSTSAVALRKSIVEMVFLVTALLATKLPPISLNGRRRGAYRGVSDNFDTR